MGVRRSTSLEVGEHGPVGLSDAAFDRVVLDDVGEVASRRGSKLGAGRVTAAVASEVGDETGVAGLVGAAAQGTTDQRWGGGEAM